PFAIDRDRDLIGLLVECVGTAFGQLDRDPARKQWRGNHEDDQQDEHHVHERRDVDLRHRRPPPPSATRRGMDPHGHQVRSNSRPIWAWTLSAKRCSLASNTFTLWLKRL